MTDPLQKRMTDAITASGYKTGSLIAQLTPGPMAQVTASLLGAGLSTGMRSRRAMIERHLKRVNPRLSGLALRVAVQGAFDSYARYWVESFRLPALSTATVERGFTTDGYREHILGALARGTGAILALPHLGGWEWAGRWLTAQGHRVTVVVEPLDNEELFDWFAELRRKLGMIVVPLGPEAGPAVIKAVKDNEIVCLLCDRDIKGGGVEVDFFGERTTLPAGPATVALRTGAALIPVATYFTPRYNGHHAVVRPPIPVERRGSLREDVARITQALARELEVLIGRAPEQWHLFQPNWPSDPGYGV